MSGCGVVLACGPFLVMGEDVKRCLDTKETRVLALALCKETGGWVGTALTRGLALVLGEEVRECLGAALAREMDLALGKEAN